MIENIKKDLLENISENRYLHTMRVVETCERLAKVHNEDLEKVRLAALLHDSAKFISKDRVFEMAKELDILDDEIYGYNIALVHAPLAAKIASDKYAIKDQDILNAISYHTTCRENMSLLEKIVFMGDYIEPSRDFRGIEEIRKLAFDDLDGSLILAIDTNIKFLLERGKLISLDSIKARNYLLIEKIKKEGNK